MNGEIRSALTDFVLEAHDDLMAQLADGVLAPLAPIETEVPNPMPLTPAAQRQGAKI